MKNILKLSFLTSASEISVLNIQHPFLGVSDSEVKDAMARIIGSDAILSKNALLTRKNGAELLTVTEKQFDI